jgi:lipoate-protein ligase A
MGYSQKLSAQAVRNIAQKGLSIVRRPTGGRAVLHNNDFTYSFVASSRPKNEAMSDGILCETLLGAYSQICQALIYSLALLGVDLEVGRSKSINRSADDCFDTTTIADLHYRGKKLVGSAQVRRKQAVLQHGSIILDQPQDLLPLLLSKPDDHTTSAGDDPTISARHANLFEIIGREVSIDEMQAALRSGFEKAFGLTLIPSQLSPEELAISQRLLPKYASTESLATISRPPA